MARPYYILNRITVYADSPQKAEEELRSLLEGGAMRTEDSGYAELDVVEIIPDTDAYEEDDLLVLSDGTGYGGRRQYDDDGKEIVHETTCGACGFVWNDAVITQLTPAPSGRCPNEYNHSEH